MKPHAFHPEADAEYAEAAQYYAAMRPELGGRFHDEIEAARTAICQKTPGAPFQVRCRNSSDTLS